jgi:hypothetical protein
MRESFEVVNHRYWVIIQEYSIIIGGLLEDIIIRFAPTFAEVQKNIFSRLDPCRVWWLRLSWCPLKEWTQ